MRRILVMSLCWTSLLVAAQTPPKQEVLSAPGGRFVFGQVSEFQRDKYMLDTQTGRLWQLVRASATDDSLVLQVIPYADPAGKLTTLPPPQTAPTGR